MDLYHSQLARTLASRGRNAAVRVPAKPVLRRRKAVVTGITNNGKYASVQLNGSAVVMANQVVNPAYSPKVGDTCWVHLNGAGICDVLVDSLVVNPNPAITLP